VSDARSLADRRIRLLLAVLAIAFAVSLVRAVWLQAVRAAPLASMAQTQHRQPVVLPARRGTIFDRSGVQLAIGEQRTTVYADPRQVRNPRAVAAAAERLLGADPTDLLAAFSQRRKGFVYIARQADSEAAAKFVRLGFAGVSSYPEERRAYPQGAVAAHVLGYAGVDNRGLAGLEQSLDRDLTGRPGSQLIVKDAFGRTIDVLSTRAERDGRDVYLTIDSHIQAKAEEVLRDTVRDWGAKAASAIVLDPRTGAVLAMAVSPQFDANRFNATAPARTRNRAVTDTYEPGSTFKLVTVAGALADHVVTPRTRFRLPYQIHVADRWIHDSHFRETETLSVSEILARSSNVGIVTLAEELGETRLKRWLARFGLGTSTGIDFPGESAGIMPQWSGSTIGNVPIGQGIAVTGIRMASIYAAIANKGVWIEPHLVDRVVGRPAPRRTHRRIVGTGVAAQLSTMLRRVVGEGGTGINAAIPGYNVAGKTGTAQKPDPRGGYSSSKYVASFVGFVPASKPELVVLVSVDEPTRSIWGGDVAAPAFAAIAKFALQYLEVPPDATATATGSDG
jgi:cell division protein FtsI (penicillin-binding protein 3)